MTNKLTANLFPQVNRQKQLFWLLSGVAGFLVVMYMILIQSAIYNVVVEKKVSYEYRNIQSDMLTIEEEYLAKAKDVTINSIGDFGLVSLGKNDVHYVKAEIGSGLSLNIDGR